MGLLSLGTPLAWQDAKQYADHVRKHGILQFLHIYNQLKDRECDELLWGDEALFITTTHIRLGRVLCRFL
jgi:glutamate--cysteine ligase catalytic subunit